MFNALRRQILPYQDIEGAQYLVANPPLLRGLGYEIGTAIGLGKPYFYFNYADKRMVQIGGKQERITTDSDLAGMLYMPYREYNVLLREFAVRLPQFLCGRRLAKREARQ
jgi:hypothetical protein